MAAKRSLFKDLVAGRTYEVEVQAVGNRTTTANSDWSDRLSFSTEFDSDGPTAPANQTAYVRGGNFYFEWDAPSDGDLYDYEVTIQPAGVASDGAVWIVRDTFVVLGAQTNRTIYDGFEGDLEFFVSSRDSAGNASAQVSDGATNAAPGAFTLSVIDERAGAIFTWTEPTGDDIDYYEIHKSASPYATTTSRSFIDLDDNGTSTAYFIRAYDIYGNTTDSNTVNVTIETLDDRYVDEAGDTMTGALIIDYHAASDGALRIYNGDSGDGPGDDMQIEFGWSGDYQYSHNIRTRHDSGAAENNAIDFYVWNHGVDAVGDYGTKHVMTVDGTGVGIFTGGGAGAMSAALQIDAGVVSQTYYGLHINFDSNPDGDTALRMDADQGGFIAFEDGVSGDSIFLPNVVGESIGVSGYGMGVRGQMPVADDSLVDAGGAIVLDGRRNDDTALTAAHILNVRNDGTSRFRITAGGHVEIAADAGELRFGSASDTNLYRDSANVLKTDDSFVVGGTLTVQGASGTINGNTIVTYADAADATPIALTPDIAGAIGTATDYAREDHVHNVPAAAPTGSLGNSSTNTEGSAGTFARSDHTHDIADDYVLNTGDAMSGFLTLNADPNNALHAATKQYVDTVAQGLDAKDSVRAATTANITLSGTQTIDGVSVVADDRVLVKNQTDATENGIYVVAAGAWSRATDQDEADEFAGSFTFVEEGTTNADSGWVCTTDEAVTIGVTDIDWSQFSGAGQITAGAGMTKSGNTLDVIGTSGGGIIVNADDLGIDWGETGDIAQLGNAVGSAAGVLAEAARVDHTHDIADDYVLNTGDTMTGLLTLSADPTANLHAATKQYVDAQVGANTDADTLDGLDSTQFVRSDVNDTVNGRLEFGYLTAASAPIWLESGDTSTAANNYHQMLLSYNGNKNYTHTIRTRHAAGAVSQNAIDIMLWQTGDVTTALGSNHVLSIDGAGLGVFTGTVALTHALDVVGDARIQNTSDTQLTLEDTVADNQVRLHYKTASYDWVVGLHGGEQRFKIQTGTSFSTSPQFSIEEAGNVGIGVNDPATKLHIGSADGDILRLQSNLAGTGARAYMSFYESDGVRTGYVGNAAATSDDIYLVSDSADVWLQSGGGATRIGGDVFVSGGAVNIENANGGDTWFNYNDLDDNYITHGASGFTRFRSYNGTTATTIFDVDDNGISMAAGSDVEFTNSADGVILKSPDGTRWRVTIDNTGNLTSTSL